MANTKTGLSYYTVDTDRYQDRRIKRLKKDMGCKGIAVYDYLLCEIYRVRGCYLEYDEDTIFDVADYFNLSETLVREIVEYCGAVGLFSKELLSRGIITSSSIQQRYLGMCGRAKRKGPAIPPEVNVLPVSIEMLTDEAEPLPITISPAEVVDEPKPKKPKLMPPPKLTLDEEIETLKNETLWLDQLQVVHGTKVDDLRAALDEFKAHCLADGRTEHDNLTDAKQHFNNWLRIVTSKQNNNESNRPKRNAERRGNLLGNKKKDWDAKI